MKNTNNYIPLNKCKHGYLYIIDARNQYIGIYNKHVKGFIILRTKFNCKYLFTEYHWDIGGDMSCYGTVKPIRALEKSNFKITKSFKDFQEHNTPERELNNKIFDYLKSKECQELHDEFVNFITKNNELLERIYKKDLDKINKKHKKDLDTAILNHNDK